MCFGELMWLWPLWWLWLLWLLWSQCLRYLLLLPSLRAVDVFYIFPLHIAQPHQAVWLNTWAVWPTTA